MFAVNQLFPPQTHSWFQLKQPLMQLFSQSLGSGLTGEGTMSEGGWSLLFQASCAHCLFVAIWKTHTHTGSNSWPLMRVGWISPAQSKRISRPICYLMGRALNWAHPAGVTDLVPAQVIEKQAICLFTRGVGYGGCWVATGHKNPDLSRRLFHTLADIHKRDSSILPQTTSRRLTPGSVMVDRTLLFISNCGWKKLLSPQPRFINHIKAFEIGNETVL